MKVTLTQLRLLVMVAETASIGASARRLGMTQSGASQSVAALERSLGAVLLTRTRDGVALTALAHEVLADAELALDAVERIEERAAAAGGHPERTIRIATVPSAAASLLPACLKNFRRLQPQTRLSVFEGSHLEVGAWVRGGIADVGLAAVVPAGVAAQLIRDEELIVVARRGHRALRGAAVTIESLAGTAVVTAGHGCGPILGRLFGSAHRPVPHTVRARDIATALEMVRQGLGVTVLPATVMPRPDMLDLRVGRFSPRAHRQLYAIRAAEPASAVPTDALIEAIKAASIETAGHQLH